MQTWNSPHSGLVHCTTVREFVTFGFKICTNSLKFVELFWGDLCVDNGVLKNSQATTKRDAEMNWSTYDFIRLKRKLDNNVRALSNLSSCEL